MAPYSADISNPEQITRIHAADETTPLLIASGSGIVKNGVDSHDNHETFDETNDHGAQDTDANATTETMPYTQVILLCWCAISEPTAYFGIFPFINEMIAVTGGIDEKDVGFWSGLIESLFSLVQMVLMIFYGRMADRLGRKPVLVFSLTGITIATALFGMSQKLWVMIMFRCLAGAFAGSVVTVRTMLSEITTKETQGRAFSWYMFSRNMGILLGPVIGVSI
jgi:MFS family permease